jgi:hypothetical protein
MPQFDFYTFFVQTFWFSLLTCFFYLMYLKFPIQNSSQVLKMRSKLQNLYSALKGANKSSTIYQKIVIASLRKR